MENGFDPKEKKCKILGKIVKNSLIFLFFYLQKFIYKSLFTKVVPK